MRRLPPLGALRAFEAAARHMSFKRAAAELAVTPTAISHQLRLLEESLGVRLFERHPRRLLLTVQGQALYPVLRDGLDAFARAIATLAAKPARRSLTVSATTAFAARWLVPRVASFSAANPDIDLRLHASDDPVDLGEGAIDVAIRYGRGDHPGLTAEPLLRDTFGVVCSPRLDVRSPADLRRHKLIHFEWRHPARHRPVWRRWLAEAGLPPSDTQAGLTFTDESHAIQAAIAGHGVALLSLVLIANELASGALVQPFGPRLAGQGYFLVYPDGDLRRDEIVALRSWIQRQLARPPATSRDTSGERAPRVTAPKRAARRR
jgi:LysR family transcriptional regulator, glycine cleavage system transcriptional activator